MNGWLSKKHQSMMETVKRDLNALKDVSITHDSWSSGATENIRMEDEGVVLETVKVTGSHTSEAKDQIDLSL